MSWRRSSPDWTETGAGVKGQLTELRLYLYLLKQTEQVKTGEGFDLEDDTDVVSQRIEVLEGQFERYGVGVEEGTRL